MARTLRQTRSDFGRDLPPGDWSNLREACYQAAEYLEHKIELGQPDYEAEDITSMAREAAAYIDLAKRIP